MPDHSKPTQENPLTLVTQGSTDGQNLLGNIEKVLSLLDSVNTKSL